jgi:dehydrogenase/reductase SDR family member 7B
MSIENRVVIITGATGNLGQVVARQYAQQGARLALFGTNEERLAKLTRDLHLPAERVWTHLVDLRDAEATRQAADALIAKYGRA